ncbi:hypothetical protein [Paenibacillus sp. TH7-28]
MGDYEQPQRVSEVYEMTNAAYTRLRPSDSRLKAGKQAERLHTENLHHI